MDEQTIYSMNTQTGLDGLSGVLGFGPYSNDTYFSSHSYIWDLWTKSAISSPQATFVLTDSSSGNFIWLGGGSLPKDTTSSDFQVYSNVGGDLWSVAVSEFSAGGQKIKGQPIPYNYIVDSSIATIQVPQVSYVYLVDMLSAASTEFICSDGSGLLPYCYSDTQ